MKCDGLYYTLAGVSFGLSVMGIVMLYKFATPFEPDFRNFNFLFWGVWGCLHIIPTVAYGRHLLCKSVDKVTVCKRYQDATTAGVLLAYVAYFCYLLIEFDWNDRVCIIAARNGQFHIKHCRVVWAWQNIYIAVAGVIFVVQRIVSLFLIKYAQEELYQANEI